MVEYFIFKHSTNMLTHILGYPRIGSKRELKKACEQFWSGKISKEELQSQAYQLRLEHWKIQQENGIDLIPSNDFSLYDHVLDLSLTLGVIPQRYQALVDGKSSKELEIYFAMARGYQKEGFDVVACEMTKWFDTNYHYIVPEFTKNQQFYRFSNKPIQEFEEAKRLDIITNLS
jgi:5-methyltetrahydropteroyltriglutamate--homocysteine methyltransferase